MQGTPGGDDGRRQRRLGAAVVVLVALLVVLGIALGLALSDSGSTQATGVPALKRSSPTTAAKPTPPSTVAASSTTSTTKPPAAPAATPTAAAPLAGKVIAIDPGHNGDNYTDPSYINSTIWNGRESEACDTTGTETDGGYTEALFNFNVANDLAADLRAEGASLVMTRTTNSGVGPCVTERAAIGNNAHANAALSIHADGGPPSGRGFAILEPVADGPNDQVIVPSATLGSDIRAAFLSQQVEETSTYDGVDGVQPRDDLGGLNLTTVPKVMVECANMRNAADAALVVTPSWQQSVATALAAGITQFLG